MKFTENELHKIADALGMGTHFDWYFGDGSKVEIVIRRNRCVFYGGEKLSPQARFGIMVAWMVEGWRKKAGYRGGYKLDDLVKLVNRLSDPEYTDMPVDELIERTKTELDKFWNEVSEYEYKPGTRGIICPTMDLETMINQEKVGF